ncbi:phosphoribosylglycinamide synthetase [Streptomyces jumonjinensis]|uniref:phosphoribosylglycinamide synthetase n=1 Tax=Streptomyces jumonjinensis TaxID=1945 RepID=UPI001297FBEF|nr:phosphoribosylglycinamide synthetase [Streptomyces jumonjinensis]
MRLQSALDTTPEKAAARLRPYTPVCVLACRQSGVPLADALAERLGLPGNSVASSPARHDRYRAGEALRHAGVRGAAQFAGDDSAALADWAALRGSRPVTVGPVCLADRGVTVCQGPDEVRETADRILSARPRPGGAPSPRALVREFLGGDAYTVDTVSCAGRRYVAAVRRRLTARRDGRVVHDRSLLVSRTLAPAPALIAYAHEVLDALGVVHGPARTTVVQTPAGPVLLKNSALLGDDVLPGYDDVCLGANPADLTALACTAPDDFLSRWAGLGYDKLCEAEVIVIGDRGRSPAGPGGAAVIGAIEALPSVYCFTPGPAPAGHGPGRPPFGRVHALNGSARQLERDRLHIHGLTSPAALAAPTPTPRDEAVCAC